MWAYRERSNRRWLHNLHPSPCITKTIKSRKVLMGRACTIYRREEKRNTFKLFSREAEETTWKGQGEMEGQYSYKS
jgi:hypothetical protein